MEKIAAVLLHRSRTFFDRPLLTVMSDAGFRAEMA
jgi:hypothetical protein